MRLNVFTFNQVNLQRACGYQAVVVSGGSGAVRLSLHSLLQWQAVTACSFWLGILQRFCLFFYDIRGGFFSPLSSVLLILPLRDVSGSVYVRRWRKFPVVLRPVRMLWVCVVVGRSSSRTSRKIVFGLRTLHLSLLVVLLAVLQLVSFPLALLTSDSIFRLGHGSTLAISSAYRRYPSSIGIGLCAAVLRLYPFIHRALRGVRSFRLRCFRAAGPFFLCKMFMPFSLGSTGAVSRRSISITCLCGGRPLGLSRASCQFIVLCFWSCLPSAISIPHGRSVFRFFPSGIADFG